MDLRYKNPGFQYSIDSIMLFQNEENSEWWRESLFYFYPQIDRNRLDSLPANEKHEYLEDMLREVYNREESEISFRTIKYNEHWNIHKAQIEEAFSEAFGLDCHSILNNIVGNVTLNPICPRFLDTCSFDVLYLSSQRGALGTALHEIVHFVWFYVWQRHFRDDQSEYETPHLKWVFSEMAVEPIMRNDNRLRSLNPYFDSGCVYDYFYKMVIDGKPILETLYAMYKDSDIIHFMEQGYEYCKHHESEIRNQMA